ncbi:3-deoxy-D-arabino-heptulosonate 7-phosphate (DAHP) synthase [Candidatus Scalindua japonica]|uniref:3-deoxy-D-arabino-heptulosonate 7-phosphate (DAHP) synthase n=2 Tax=Candidatus Scalindua japonica TaxID=1284222 RepID=A0A286TU07_9BACT|nr:3-deoxy-D-arabino-heptulosonate 7-phosphate (DAHP) synthase [Candidatus Scalindua japonica]
MLLHTNETILNLEDELKTVQKQQDKFHAEYADIKTVMIRQTERMKKLEKIGSFVKTENISKSFETTLEVTQQNHSMS